MHHTGLKLAVTSLLLAFSIEGCSASNEAMYPRTTSGTAKSLPRSPGPAEAPLSAAVYFAQATALDLFELRAADIALQRGTARTKTFAAISKRQHEAIAAQFAFAGRRLNLLPSTVLPARYQQMLATLVSATNFDSVYLSQQRVITAQGLSLHSSYASSGKSPTLRPVAEFAAEAITNEIRHLER